jgi:AraC family transcriptional regulator
MTPTDLTYRQRILKVQVFIQEHLAEELPLDRLARLAHFSPYHFHRIFKALVGEGVSEHVRRLRLEAAAMALKNTQRGVLEVALDVGYGTHEAFTRAFRQLFGVSPSQYRAGKRPILFPKELSTMTAAETSREVRLENMPARRVAFVRHVGPYGDVGPAWQKLMTWAGPRGLFFRPGVMILGICHDDPDVTPPEKIRYDCCITVGDDVTAEGEIGVQTLDPGEYAVVTHRGPYEGLGETYRWLYGRWLPESGREPRHAPPFEVYRNSPTNTPPEQLVTDIYLPLKPV